MRMTGAPAKRLVATAVLLVAALVAPAAARAQTFPDDARLWTSFSCGNAPMTDAVADHGGALRERDLVGNGQAPTGLRTVDQDFLYLRLRVDDDPRQGANLRAGAWGFAFRTDLASQSYQVLVTVDGTNRLVSLYRNSVVTLQNSPLDLADPAVVASYPVATHARVVEADTTLAGRRDHFLDLAVPWRDLAMVDLLPTTATVTWAASSTAPDRLDLDFACHDAGGTGGTPSLSESASRSDRTSPSSGGGGGGGPGGGGGAGGISLEGGPGCAMAAPAGPTPISLLPLLLLAGILRRRR